MALNISFSPVSVYSYQEKRKGLSMIRTYFSLVKSMICTGILYQPRSFYLGGILFSIVSCIIFGWLSLICMKWLVKAHNQFKGTYAEITGIAIGPIGKYSVDLIICITQIGPPVITTGFIIENTLQSLSNLDAKTDAYIIMIVLLICLIPLCLIKTIGDASITHIIADIIIIGSILIMGIYSASQGVNSNNMSIINPKYMTYTLGTLIYGFEGIALMLPIKSEMLKPFKFERILAYMMITIILVFLWFSTLSVFAYGSEVKDIVSLNLPKTPLVSIMLLFYVIAAILTIPLFLYPAFLTVETYFNLSGVYNQATKIFIVSCVVVLGTLGKDHLGLIVSIMGSIFCSPLSFIFPSIINFKLNAKTSTEKKYSIIMLVIGILFEILAIFTTFYLII